MKVKLEDVRLAFPDVFEATQYQGKGAYRYNATFLVVPGSKNHQLINAAILAAAEEKWPKKAMAMVESLRNNSNKFCYLDGNTKEYDGFEGLMYLASHRRQEDGRPTLLNRDKTPLVAADGKPYGGCYVNASVDIWAQVGENTGIRCSLLGIQFNRDGDAFGGSAAASPDEFDDLGVPETADDLT